MSYVGMGWDQPTPESAYGANPLYYIIASINRKTNFLTDFWQCQLHSDCPLDRPTAIAIKSVALTATSTIETNNWKLPGQQACDY